MAGNSLRYNIGKDKNLKFSTFNAMTNKIKILQSMIPEMAILAASIVVVLVFTLTSLV